MNVLTVAGIVPGPRHSVDATVVAGGAHGPVAGGAHGPVAGHERPVRVHHYQGIVTLERNRTFRGLVRLTDVTPVTFFVPDSLDHREEPRSVHTEVGIRHYVSSANVGAVGIGPTWATTAVVPDPRGGDGRWLQTQMHLHGHGVETLELNYRIEVVTNR
ncbi:hypothetical protein [Gordonia aurantiaca]|uniref:hypothetical protein n=1 Tax=Gordonia sp. B21 TaxID=3151852 RepID=UPI003263EC72